MVSTLKKKKRRQSDKLLQILFQVDRPRKQSLKSVGVRSLHHLSEPPI